MNQCLYFFICLEGENLSTSLEVVKVSLGRYPIQTILYVFSSHNEKSFGMKDMERRLFSVSFPFVYRLLSSLS